MSLASLVHDVFAANASFLGTTLEYRLLANNTWGSFTNFVGEIKETNIGWEYDEKHGERIRRERAVLKVYDRTSTTAPTLRLGDQIRDASSKYWTVESIRKAEIGNGIYRYGIVRDLPIRGEADRGGNAQEGGTTPVTGNVMGSFIGTNEEASATAFVGAFVHKTTTGITLARNDQASKDAVGCVIGTAAAPGENATVVTENAVTLTDWTNALGATQLTVGTDYFLSATPGKITATPNTSGWLQFVGTAITAYTLDLRIGQAVRL